MKCIEVVLYSVNQANIGGGLADGVYNFSSQGVSMTLRYLVMDGPVDYYKSELKTPPPNLGQEGFRYNEFIF